MTETDTTVGDSSPPEAPPIIPDHRAPWSWAVLAAIFCFMVYSQVVVRAPEPSTTKFDEAESVLKLKSLMISKHGSGATTPKGQSIFGLPTTDDSLKKLKKELSSDSATDPEAAKLALAVDYELGAQPDTKALALLEKSKDRSDQEFATVYKSERLDREWVMGAKVRFPKNFLGRVVFAQALAKSGDAGALGRMIEPRDQFGLIAIGMGGLTLVLLGFAVVVATIVGLSTGSLKPVGHPMRGLSAADADRLALRMSFFLILLMVVPSLVVYLLGSVILKYAAVVFGEIALAALVFWSLKAKVLGVADPVRKLVGRTKNWSVLVLYGVIAFAGSAPITITFALLAQNIFKDGPRPTHPLSEQLSFGASPIALVMMFILAAVAAPLLEELSFRGMLFPALSRYIGPVWAILLSGFLFGAIHPQGPILWAALGGIGAVSALLTYITGSLVPSMVMHACHNAAILTLSVVLLY